MIHAKDARPSIPQPTSPSTRPIHAEFIESFHHERDILRLGCLHVRRDGRAIPRVWEVYGRPVGPSHEHAVSIGEEDSHPIHDGAEVSDLYTRDIQRGGRRLLRFSWWGVVASTANNRAQPT